MRIRPFCLCGLERPSGFSRGLMQDTALAWQPAPSSLSPPSPALSLRGRCISPVWISGTAHVECISTTGQTDIATVHQI